MSEAADSTLLVVEHGHPIFVDPADVRSATDNPLLDQLSLRGIAIMQAGYPGIECHYTDMKEGRFFIAWNVNLETPEGRMFTALNTLADAGVNLPDEGMLLDILTRIYAEQGEGA